jgi:ABC-type transport system involved in cytochrome c biogenesis permease subunit
MTWLERISNGFKFRASVMLIVVAILAALFITGLSAYYNVKQGKTAIEQETLNMVISFFKDIALVATGFLFRGQNNKSNNGDK